MANRIAVRRTDTRGCLYIVVALWVLGGAMPAHAWEWSSLWKSWRMPIDRTLSDLDEARTAGDLTRANQLLKEAEAILGPQDGRLLYQRALMARDAGESELAVTLFAEAVKQGEGVAARLEQAGLLVKLGRWPQAVDVLSETFVVAGSKLRVDDVMVDPRFTPILSFAPYEQLIRNVRSEQSGPIGRLLMEFEKVEQTGRAAAHTLETIGNAISMVRRILDFRGTYIIALLMLSIGIALGIQLFGLLRPPVTLLLGGLSASVFWYVFAKALTLGSSNGFATIMPAMAIIVLPVVVLYGGRFLRRRMSRQQRLDPFAKTQLPTTLALADEFLQLAKVAQKNPDDTSERARLRLEEVGTQLGARLLGKQRKNKEEWMLAKAS